MDGKIMLRNEYFIYLEMCDQHSKNVNVASSILIPLRVWINAQFPDYLSHFLGCRSAMEKSLYLKSSPFN